MALVVVRREVIEAGEVELVPRAALVEAFRRLERDPEAGKPLVRELKGCRSLRLRGSENRLIYRLRDDVVEILAIGRRRDSEVHGAAAARRLTGQ